MRVILVSFPNDAARFLSAFSFPGRSDHFQRLRAEFVGDPRPNDRPTMDDICGPPVPGSSSAAPPNEARPKTDLLKWIYHLRP
ncbi:hypothetical protein ARMGADRAFT_290724 [Armillaria gallica]|uniref:Uncharacterized protein n=1 Tax=Armillaria gallica TaxID=47427 RepID=A0A2H3D631_ARMGA|nr:hypothetical protein ARMGADRAFT_290724 [Armillaria gallica]